MLDATMVWLLRKNVVAAPLVVRISKRFDTLPVCGQMRNGGLALP